MSRLSTDPLHIFGGGAAVDEVGDGDVRDAGVGGEADLAGTAVGVADRDAFDLVFELAEGVLVEFRCVWRLWRPFTRIGRAKLVDRHAPHTVLEVSARVKKSVPLYKGDNEFSILEGGNYAFKTVSPDPGPPRPEKHMRWHPTTLCGEGILPGCNSGDRC